MATDDDEAFAGSESFLKTMELRQDVKTIDAAVSEEVDQNQRSAEMRLPSQRLVYVEPVEPFNQRFG